MSQSFTPKYSCLYDCQVRHIRRLPVLHQFHYRYFTFCLDLDEWEQLAHQHFLLGNQWNCWFRFKVSDFLLGAGLSTVQELKQSVLNYVQSQNELAVIQRVVLIAHLRTLGYAFNPAAFYYCYDSSHELVCGILEVTNTDREQKLYFIPKSSQSRADLYSQQVKAFYVSPFVKTTELFDIAMNRPGDILKIQIQSLPAQQETGVSGRRTQPLVQAILVGYRRPITDGNLFWRGLKAPLLTLGIMVSIHIQAARMYLKKIPHFKKKRHHLSQ